MAKRVWASCSIASSASSFGSTAVSLRVSYELIAIQPWRSTAGRKSSSASRARPRGSITNRIGAGPAGS